MTVAPINLHWNHPRLAADKRCNQTNSFPRSLLTKLVEAHKKRKQQRIDRDAFNSLLRLDDRALLDIGLKREDVLWASRLPLSFNASQELKQLR